MAVSTPPKAFLCLMRDSSVRYIGKPEVKLVDLLVLFLKDVL